MAHVIIAMHTLLKENKVKYFKAYVQVKWACKRHNILGLKKGKLTPSLHFHPLGRHPRGLSTLLQNIIVAGMGLSKRRSVFIYLINVQKKISCSIEAKIHFLPCKPSLLERQLCLLVPFSWGLVGRCLHCPRQT